MVEGASSVRLGRLNTSESKWRILVDGQRHADRDELVKFAKPHLAEKRPKAIFTAIGEPSVERFLAQRIHDHLGGNAIVPELGTTWEITKDSVVLTVLIKTGKAMWLMKWKSLSRQRNMFTFTPGP